MRPEAIQPGGGGGADEETGEFNTWLALQKTTDKQCANLIAHIVGHPTGAPNVRELDDMNPSLEADQIQHLPFLSVDDNISKTIERPSLGVVLESNPNLTLSRAPTS